MPVRSGGAGASQVASCGVAADRRGQRSGGSELAHLLVIVAGLVAIAVSSLGTGGLTGAAVGAVVGVAVGAEVIGTLIACLLGCLLSDTPAG